MPPEPCSPHVPTCSPLGGEQYNAPCLWLFGICSPCSPPNENRTFFYGAIVFVLPGRKKRMPRIVYDLFLGGTGGTGGTAKYIDRGNPHNNYMLAHAHPPLPVPPRGEQRGNRGEHRESGRSSPWRWFVNVTDVLDAVVGDLGWRIVSSAPPWRRPGPPDTRPRSETPPPHLGRFCRFWHVCGRFRRHGAEMHPKC